MSIGPWPSWRVQPCGTEAAYMRHRRRSEKPCQACTEAHTRADAGRETIRRQRALREEKGQVRT